MNFKKLAVALTIAGVTAFSGAASAVTTVSLTNLDGTNSPFGGFDWASGAAAWTNGYIGAPGSAFTLYYAGWATSVTTPGGNTLPGLVQLDTSADGVANSIGQTFTIPGKSGSYEYTVFATFQERVVSCASASQCTFQVIGGSFDIFYDTAANAKIATNGAWTGFEDGVKIISGTINGGATADFNTSTGGQETLAGQVTYTNALYVNPKLVTTNVSSTLQLGSAVTNFSTPTSVDARVIAPTDIRFQADANQTFSPVPEPTTMSLFGLALLAMGLVARRRKSS